MAPSSMAVAARARVLPGLLRRCLSTSPITRPSPFAYGKPNFKTVRDNGSFFADNTRVIRALYMMDAEVASLHRPPRFGKSLFLSTMEAYYDVAVSAEDRARLFHGLDIGRDPVPGAGKYFVLKWDFSVDVGGDAEAIATRLHGRLNKSVRVMADKYNLPWAEGKALPKSILVSPTDGLASFDSLVDVVAATGRPLMVLIDEYDRFANKLLFENPSMYSAVVAGVSGQRGSSMLRSIFESVKMATSTFEPSRGDGLPFRVLTVGLSPMALADASGVNYLKDVTHRDELADALGFKRADLERGMKVLVDHGRVKPDQAQPLLALMEKYYNGYKFHLEQHERLYNPTLCVSLFDRLWAKPALATELLAAPQDIESTIDDTNVRISENVFDLLAQNRLTEGLVTKLKDGPVPLDKSVEHVLKMRDLTTDLGAQSKHFLLSLMYYHGMVTYGDAPKPGDLRVPNALARGVFLDRIVSFLKPHAAKFLRTLAPADLAPVLERALHSLTAMDDRFNELTLKALLMGLLQPYAEELESEAELDGGKKRVDLLVTSNDGTGRCAIIECKTLMPHSLDLSGFGNSFTRPWSKLSESFTYKWSIANKRAAHKILRDTPRAQLLELAVPDGVSWDPPARTASEYFGNGKRQIQEYGVRFVNQPGRAQRPKLLFVSTFWCTHLAIEEVAFEQR